MPALSTSSETSVYQLRVVLRAVSPLIWRRLLVRSETTIAHLHSTLQTAFGWTDEHLNRSVIHGREYGVSHDGGIGFDDDPDTYAWPTSASAHVNGSCMSTTLATNGNTKYGWSNSYRLKRDATIRCALGVNVLDHPKIVAAHRRTTTDDEKHCGG